MIVFRSNHFYKYYHFHIYKGVIMNSFKQYEEFKIKKEAFKLQCFFMYSCGLMLFTTVLLAIFALPVFIIISCLKFSFIMFILLITCIIQHGSYITYNEYKRSKKVMYAYLDKILENSSDNDDEIIILMKDYKKFK